MRAAFVLKDRSDQELLAGLQAAVGREREDLAAVIAHLAEMDRRDLALPEGCSSLSKYCIEVLHLTERQAYRRVDVAKRAKQFPIILEMLADGVVNVTTVLRLGPSLTEENHIALLTESKQMTREELEDLVARLRPKPPVTDLIRKLPSRSTSDEGRAPEAEPAFFSEIAPEDTAQETGAEAVPTAPAHEATPVRVPGSPQEAAPVRVQPSSSYKPAVSPLAEEIYKFQFTGSARLKLKFKQLQELMRHRVPNGDLATLFEMGVDLLLEEASRDKFGKSDRPRKAKNNRRNGTQKGADESRHIPNHVKREVWSRDKGRCAFVSKRGLRCSERGRIEYHHVVPFAWGGESTVLNIQLRCRAHNAYEGEAIFGRVVRNGKKGRAGPTDPTISSVDGNGKLNQSP